MPTEFINADLEIFSDQDLEPIRVSFAKYGARFAEMYCGQTEPNSYLAAFEIHPDEGTEDQSAEVKIQAFCESIAELRGEAQELWKTATRRVIDLGYLADDRCKPFNDHLSLETLSRMNYLGIELALTIYPKIIEKAEQVGDGDAEEAV